jgi:sodium/hydrogen antiporter
MMRHAMPGQTGKQQPMNVSDLAIVAALVFAYGTLSARLERVEITGPITFVLAGVLLTHGPLAPLGITPSHETVKALAEGTLVLVLFSDASRVSMHDLRPDAGLYARLLGAGLPLTIGLGTVAALALFHGMGGWMALIVGAALAPTDAALGAGLMTNPAVPARLRRLINVESGLNDGIATPVVLIAVAGAGSAGHGGSGPGRALAEMAAGVLAGIVVGCAGGLAVKTGRRRGWVAEGFAGPAVLALAVCCYACSLALHGNGFIAAFTGGLAFGAAGGRPGERLVPFVEETGGLVSLMVWLAFGAVAVVPAVQGLTWQTVGYAVLSLTVIRMAPVALALAGARLGRAAVSFIGWFGPRGLASVIFALVALEDLGQRAAGTAVTVIATTVLLSVVVHGTTADPLSRRMGPRLTAAGGTGSSAPAPAERRLIRRA